MRIIDREAFRAHVVQKGYTVSELADTVGCSRTTIGRLRSLNGKPPTIGGTLAAEIEQALDVAPGTLFRPNPPRSPRAAWTTPRTDTEGGEQA